MKDTIKEITGKIKVNYVNVVEAFIFILGGIIGIITNKNKKKHIYALSGVSCLIGIVELIIELEENFKPLEYKEEEEK